MTIAYSKSFIKQAKKLDVANRQKLLAKIALFSSNPLHPALRNHALKGKYKDYRSIDITGDVRALYLTTGEQTVFDAVGSHSQLYG